MPSNYTGVSSTFTTRNLAPIQEPTDSDAPNAASVNTALSKLADLAASLLAQAAILQFTNNFTSQCTFTPAVGQVTTLNRASDRGSLNVVPTAGDPSAPQNGDIWYNSTTGTLRCMVGGVIKTIQIA